MTLLLTTRIVVERFFKKNKDFAADFPNGRSSNSKDLHLLIT
nr:MAG TPA: LRV protein FeS4 cluster [Caudoviricetes sp.]